MKLYIILFGRQYRTVPLPSAGYAAAGGHREIKMRSPLLVTTNSDYENIFL
jgi:hypothetical protein